MLTPLAPKDWDLSKAAHLLNRAGFGGAPAEIEALHKAGFEAAVEKILNAPDDSAAFPKPDWAAPQDMMEMQMAMRNLPENERREKMQAEQKSRMEQIFGLVDWWLERMRRSPNQLREKMTLFWHGHFATSVLKVREPFGLWQQNETLRQNALGNFATMTKAIARDPAMILYLDTQQNHKSHPNENFARELMELFTLGIGNYTEEDIQQGARTFTCYKINPRTMAFQYADFERDDGEKKIFGRTGNFNADDFIDLILGKAACARHIAKKLWTFFAYEEPAVALVDQLADSFRGNFYGIRPLMGEILRSAEFYSPAAMRSQVKSPVQWLVQTARQLEVELPEGRAANNALRSLGQVPFFPPSVKGWDGGRAWINASTLLQRYNIAGFFANGGPMGMGMMRNGDPRMMARDRGKSDGVDLAKIAPPELRAKPKALVETLGFRLFQTKLTPKESEVFLKFLDGQHGEIGDQTIRGLLHLMMSTPEFQLT
jgi:uncharacterized protein (DUF1800 family)